MSSGYPVIQILCYSVPTYFLFYLYFLGNSSFWRFSKILAFSLPFPYFFLTFLLLFPYLTRIINCIRIWKVEWYNDKGINRKTFLKFITKISNFRTFTMYPYFFRTVDTLHKYDLSEQSPRVQPPILWSESIRPVRHGFYYLDIMKCVEFIWKPISCVTLLHTERLPEDTIRGWSTAF